MSPNSSTLNEEIAKLNIDVERLKRKGAAASGPEKERVKKMILQVTGIWDEIKAHQRDCTKLATNLIWVMEHVLDRMSSDVWGQGAGDVTTQSVFCALVKSASAISDFLQKPSTVRERIRSDRQDAIIKFLDDLDAMRLKVVEVRITNVERVAGLYASSLRIKHPEIPSKPAVFFGRDELVATIVQLLLCHRACRIPLLGTGGIGKTSVAVTAINDDEVRAKYGRDILFFSCESTPTAEGIIQELATSLGLQRGSNAHSFLFSYLRSRRCCLLVLDNLETAVNSDDVEHVHQLLRELDQLPGLSLIITMRGDVAPVAVEWEDVDTLRTLSIDAARRIWTRIAKTKDEKLDDLLRRLDGLPLAIRLMAHQGQYFAPTQLLRSYDTSSTKLMKVGAGGRLGSLEVSIELSLGSKILLEEPSAGELLSLMCLLPGGATIDSLQEMVPSINNDVLQAASALQQVALAFKENERLKVLSPIRDVILLRKPPKGRSLDELRNYCIGLCSRAEEVGTVNGKEIAQVLSVEFGNINSVLLQFWKAPPAGNNIRPLVSATSQVAYFSYRCSRGDATTLLGAAHRRLDAMQRRCDAAECRRRLGDVLYLQSRYAEAMPMLEEAKSAFQASGDLCGEAQCTQSLGEVHRMQSQYTEAGALLEAAKLAYEAIGQPRGAAQCTRSLGDILRMQSRYPEAVEMLEEAKLAFEAIGNPLGAAQCIQRLSEVLRNQSQYAEAVPMLEEARLAFEAIDEPLGEAQCTQSLEHILLKQDRWEEGMLLLEEAEAEFLAIGNRAEVAHGREFLGNVLYDEQRYEEARLKLIQARDMYEELGFVKDVEDCVRALNRIPAVVGE
ncbi:TPR-like protein [Calocera viscosa TUFC12733]|uniref:TPR-like protein n=1 Tax=Calocera viscosa (strain TUFC12733) TaxID=1330018 RepID=A0A167FYN7_CALVF|nr:TPR-like protein [Calocera viscosa TUFC12733]